MTMSTSLLIGAPVPVAALHRRWCELLVEHSDFAGDVDDVAWRHEHDRYEPGCSRFSNLAGQGLCALSHIEYHPDGPIPRPPIEEGGEVGDPAYDEWAGVPADAFICAEVWMDTSYGYRAHPGGCGGLHHYLITELCEWLIDHHCPPGLLWWYAGEVTDIFRPITDLGLLIPRR